MSWKVLVIKDGQKVSLFLDNLVVSTEYQNYKVPIGDLNVVFFENTKAIVTTKIIVKLAQAKVLVMFCDNDFNPCCMLQPFKGNYMQLEILNKQISWSKENKIRIWTKIVEKKINAQIDILKLNLKSMDKVEKLFNYIKDIKPGDLSNREGHAAKVYFKELFGNNFTRDLDNHINAGLNFGYTIIRNFFSRVITSKGLNPTISIFHSNRYNAFALSDDLMEPFRPIVDNYVYNHILNDDYFSRNNRIGLINLLNAKVIFDGRELFLSNAIDAYVDNIIKDLNDEKIDKNIETPMPSSIRYYEL
ncbi:type II CRISPR-associated endonuclease Cas1 [Spiroplasma endosymbiont of Aspidapion aeneum]|uniref:type II CRISPR-associated endonuclease Cas1 n=1 Tax=Spiroplasma endosymbiont of Aspidapion aeneum TaxID=3066276 RepID=UPI00313DC22D